MSKTVFFLALIISSVLYSQNEFITIWQPSNDQSVNNVENVPFQSSNQQIWFPGIGTGYDIYWEEVNYPDHNGLLSNVTSANQVLIDFGSPFNPNQNAATYRVKVSNGTGSFNQIRFLGDSNSSSGRTGDNYKIMAVTQWGNIAWQSMESAFSGCIYLDVTANDIPDLTDVTSMKLMFSACNSLVGNNTMSNWNISNVTSLQGTFSGCYLFNQPVGNWNTQNVTDMSTTFFLAKEFNQPLANWNTSNVLHMNAMFGSALKFNQPIGNWDVHNVLETELMFSSASAFNQPLNNWNTSSVQDFRNMFRSATSFNQPLSAWNTTAAQFMGGMFRNATSFNQDISTWNTHNVELMDNMFNNAVSFNQNISNWNTSSVTTFSGMFSGAASFNQNLGSWNFPQLTSALNMFTNSGINCYNYDNTLFSWKQNTNTPSNINLGNAAPLVYSHTEAVTARSYLIGIKGWTIFGDTPDEECNRFLAVNETESDTDVVIYPNPATELLYLKSSEKIVSLRIYDSAGRLVLSSKIYNQPISLHRLKPGNYFIEVKTALNTVVSKLIKK